jgi:putative ABC transport system substrate-binding protein
MIQRRDFITLLGGAAAAWPLAAGAQQAALPVIGYVNGGSADSGAPSATAFRKGLAGVGYIDGQNVKVEHHWLEGQYDRLPSLMGDLVRRRVAMIAPVGVAPAQAAKAATATIPIVFGVAQDPVELGLVANLARPGGNATGVNFFVVEVTTKRLALLHQILPKAVQIVLLLNPSNGGAVATTLRDAKEAAHAMGLQLRVIEVTTSRDIEATFASFERERPDAVMVAGDAFLDSRSVQLANLAAHGRIPTAHAIRAGAAAGGLMSYGTDLADSVRQLGVYAGNILKGAKPADLPVVQATRFEFVINLATARTLGIEMPPTLLAIADEVIE